MVPYLSEIHGNPGSSHRYGWEAKAAINLARQTIAEALGGTPEGFIFTSGATEANNLAIKGIAEAYLARGRHVITVATEHPAVLEPCRYLERLGFELTVLPVNPDGLLDLSQLEQALRPDTILVSVMAANHEIGVLQPLVAIGELCRAQGVIFHTDAAQAIGKIPFNLAQLPVDLVSLSGHKLYGPKGIGALYCRPQHPRLALAPQLHGGGQEQGYRSGTLAPHQVVGLATAIALGVQSQSQDAAHQTQLRNQLWAKLQSLGDVLLNGHPDQCLPGCLNVSFGGIDGAALLLAIREQVAVSTGSACASEHPAPSPVLLALGRDKTLIRASLRFGIGRFTTTAEIQSAAETLCTAVAQLREVRAA
jgi:cysteine desulfurase